MILAVVAKVLYCEIVVKDFELQSRNYVPSRINNTFGKAVNSPNPPPSLG